MLGVATSLVDAGRRRPRAAWAVGSSSRGLPRGRQRFLGLVLLAKPVVSQRQRAGSIATRFVVSGFVLRNGRGRILRSVENVVRDIVRAIWSAGAPNVVNTIMTFES